jgi:hypothetical protein
MKLFIIGILLCAGMTGAWFYFFAPARKEEIEEPKYKMLDE